MQKPSMSRNPSARPQTSNIFAMGIYTAAVKAFETMPITVRRECDCQSLVAKGVKLRTIVDLKLLTRVKSQILLRNLVSPGTAQNKKSSRSILKKHTVSGLQPVLSLTKPKSLLQSS